jgi:poly(3-hydroxybutyrate) depolymerase
MTLAGVQPAKMGPRTFWVRVPADYDPNHAYRVVYLGGGYGVTTPADFFPLYDASMGGREDAIYVAVATPSDRVNDNGYDDRSGLASEEWEAFQMFQTVVDHTYCVDDNRLYAVGYETGATLANMWGCYFSGDGQFPTSTPDQPRKFAPGYHLRGEGVVSGSDPDNDPPCNGPVAFLGIHDINNGSVPIGLGHAARDRALRMNGCAGSATMAWHDDTPALASCVQYVSCPRDYPVVFCESMGLGQASQSNTAVPAFTLLFDGIDALTPTTP